MLVFFDLFFTALGIGLNFGSVLLSHIAFSIPIVVLMVLPRLNEMDMSLIDAARDLGANSWQVFSDVLIPVIMPGIFSGLFMALTYSLDDFAVTFFSLLGMVFQLFQLKFILGHDKESILRLML